jgi:hypothetical protein
MSIHAGNKGKTGERELCTHFRTQLYILSQEKKYSAEVLGKLLELVERNQNQSASGGADIILMGLAIEVKRQETLSVPAWWRQAQASAARLDARPVLIYRQNRKAWHVVMHGSIRALNGSLDMPVSVSFEDFTAWFKLYAERWVACGGLV